MKFENEFYENTNYIIERLKENLNDNCLKLKDKLYFEMTKKQIIDTFEIVLEKIKNWKIYFKNGNLNQIRLEYKEVEGYVSELELCLADLDDIFHCDAISYYLYKIGKIIIQNN